MPTSSTPPRGGAGALPPPHGAPRSRVSVAALLRAREAQGFRATTDVDGAANALCRALAQTTHELVPDARGLSPTVYLLTVARVRARATHLLAGVACANATLPLRDWRRWQLIRLDDAAYAAVKLLRQLRGAQALGTLVERVQTGPNLPPIETPTCLTDVDLARVAHTLTHLNSARASLSGAVNAALAAQIGAATFAYLASYPTSTDDRSPDQPTEASSASVEEEPPHDDH